MNQKPCSSKINNLITRKGFYHLCNMIYDRYWMMIIFVINVAIILIDRRHSGVLPVLLKDNRLQGFIYYICQWENLPLKIYGADFLHKTRSIPNISLVDLLRRDPKSILISSLDIFLKRKLWIFCWTFPETIVIKILKCWVNFVVNIAKRWWKSLAEMSQAIYMQVFIFTRYESFYFRPHLRVCFCRFYKHHWNRHSFAPW